MSEKLGLLMGHEEECEECGQQTMLFLVGHENTDEVCSYCAEEWCIREVINPWRAACLKSWGCEYGGNNLAPVSPSERSNLAIYDSERTNPSKESFPCEECDKMVMMVWDDPDYHPAGVLCDDCWEVDQ
jgi:hypothetical protein